MTWMMRDRLIAAFVWALVTSMGVWPAAAQDVPAPGTARPMLQIPRTATPPDIDGVLEDPVWREAALVDQFVQRRPVEGAPATEDTEVRLAYDSENIYVGITAHYSNPALIRANLSDRDQTGSDDTVAVLFDTFLDQQRAYLFSVNAYGVQRDALVTGGGGGGGRGRGGGGGGGGGGGRGGGGGGGGGPENGDSSWNTLYDSAGVLGDSVWTAEMKIPLKSLRYPARGPAAPHVWGMQIQRSIQGKNEDLVWSPVFRNALGDLGQMGRLEGMTALSLSRNLEFLPTFTAADAGRLDAATGDFVKDDVTAEAGIDVTYGVTSNVIANFTLNPDFSQVESDSPQIAANQRFALFFPEQRPFFLEGQEIFRIQAPITLVHTRTIVDPRYGAKLTGTLGRTTFGVMVANDEAPGQVDDPADPAFDQSALSFVGRARYDLYPQSHVGVLVTDREFLDGASRLAAFDTTLALGQTHEFSFRLAGTRHRAPGDVETAVGSWWDIGLRRQARHLNYQISHYRIDPDFETDIGFVRRVDIKRTQARVGYDWRPEGRIVQWGPTFTYARNADFSGTVTDEQFWLELEAQFANNIRVDGRVTREMERFEGVDFWKSDWQVGGNVDTSRLVSFGGNLEGGEEIRFVENPFLGRKLNVDAFATVRPTPRLETRLNLNTSRLRDPSTDEVVVDVKVVRLRTTYQLSRRLLLRNITEYDTADRAVGLNLLLTYRVNAGTAFFVGYDDHYQDAARIDDIAGDASGYRRTNRAVFTKLQYLFRY